MLGSVRATLSTSSTMTGGDQPTVDMPKRRGINRIFATLKIAYPAWYEKHFGDEAAEALGKRLWRCVTDELTDQQIDDALRRMASTSKFPLSPAEFIALANQVPGLPTESEAWIQALRGQYTHEAVQVAAHLTGTFDLRKANATDGYLKQQFERNYAIVMRRIQNGQPLDGKVHAGIGHDSSKTEAERANDLAEMQLQARLEQQRIPPGQSARELLLAKMGINRGESRA